ncbi:TadE/TadG family type IV pilus assembly protein [Vibrio neonatus]|uniref:TadE/TadG family type IV pilus assembly protein n=1 Tax=Vibrio neonatus TaxID=278860 RepID=UPI0021C47102|nr:TadE/TadG family type IV pilus assembly protein [Vibrio neonatus]
MQTRFFRKQAGLAAVEMTLVTPVLLLLLMTIFEFTLILQAKNIMLNLSREGASLISRASSYTVETVMDIIANSATPLDMPHDGTIIINQVSRRDNDEGEFIYISRQVKWMDSAISATSAIWANCPSWSNVNIDDDNEDDIKECNLPDNDAQIKIDNFPTVTIDNAQTSVIQDGESTYIVEVYYRYTPISSFLLSNDFIISERTYL